MKYKKTLLLILASTLSFTLNSMDIEPSNSSNLLPNCYTMQKIVDNYNTEKFSHEELSIIYELPKKTIQMIIDIHNFIRTEHKSPRTIHSKITKSKRHYTRHSEKTKKKVWTMYRNKFYIHKIYTIVKIPKSTIHSIINKKKKENPLLSNFNGKV